MDEEQTIPTQRFPLRFKVVAVPSDAEFSEALVGALTAHEVVVTRVICAKKAVKVSELPRVIALLSPASLATPSFMTLLARIKQDIIEDHPSHIVLFVVTEPLAALQYSALLADLPCIAQADYRPYPMPVAIQHTLTALGLVHGESVFASESRETALFRGKIHRIHDREDDAVACFQSVIAQWPTSFAAWYILGGTLGWMPKRKYDAIAVFHRMLAFNQNPVAVWQWLASLYLDVDQADQMRFAYEQALLLDTNNQIGWEQRAFILHHRLNRYEEALVAYQHVSAIYPHEVFMWDEIGDIHLDVGRFEDAVTAYDRYLTEYTDDGDVLYNKALALRHLRHFAQALTACVQAIVAYQNDVDLDQLYLDDAINLRDYVLTKIG